MWVRSKNKTMIVNCEYFHLVTVGLKEDGISILLAGKDQSSASEIANYKDKAAGMRILESIIIRQNRINAGEKLTDIYEIV